MLDVVLQDLRFAGRALRKSPVFTLVAVVVVALGTGAVSTMYSVADAVVLRPIPGVDQQSRVMAIERTRPEGGSSRSASYPYYAYIAANAKAMRGIAAMDMIPITIGDTTAGARGATAVRTAEADLVSGSYFDVLGVRPALGRFFTPDEDRVPNAHPVAVISYQLWQSAFGGDSAVVGRRALVNGSEFTIVGVAPRRFTGIYPVLRVDAWVPMMMEPRLRRGGDLLSAPGAGWLDLIGRLAPGATRERARAELAGLTQRYARAVEAGAYPDQARFTGAQITPIDGFPAGRSAPIVAFFIVLIAVAGLVMVIASVDVASMLLARAVARRREMTLRLALGAPRHRLVRQLLTESVVLFSAGGALGVVVAELATRALGRIPLPVDVPLNLDATPDARALAVTIATALATGIGFGLAPALRGSRADLAAALRGDSAGGGALRSRLRTALVAAQVAASLLLLTTSGLFVRALARGHRVDPGYDIGHVAAATMDVRLSGYDTAGAKAFYDALERRVRAIPGVEQVALARVLPLTMNSSGFDFDVPGYRSASGTRPASNANVVDAGYFAVLRQPILAGRGFLPSDDAAAPQVAVVSRRFAETFWPGQSPLGRTFLLDSAHTVTVVGVTRDVEFAQLDEPPRPFMYLPIAQHWQSDVSLLVRTRGDAAAVLPTVRAIVHALDPRLPAPTALTLEQASAVALLPQRFAVIVTAALGAIGLLLAAIGLYGVLAFSTAQRTREIGVRMALGAARARVLRLVVGDGMRLVAIGAGVGLALALAVSRVLAPFLFGLSPFDAPTFVASTVVLALTAFAACLLPARRAAALDPMAALRQE